MGSVTAEELSLDNPIKYPHLQSGHYYFDSSAKERTKLFMLNII